MQRRVIGFILILSMIFCMGSSNVYAADMGSRSGQGTFLAREAATWEAEHPEEGEDGLPVENSGYEDNDIAEKSVEAPIEDLAAETAEDLTEESAEKPTDNLTENLAKNLPEDLMVETAEDTIPLTLEEAYEAPIYDASPSITIGNTVEGNITENLREKMYQFTLPSAGKFTVNFFSQMEYYSLYVYDSNGEKVWETWNNKWNEALGYRKDLHEIYLTKGNYFLKVTSYASSTGYYRFATAFKTAGETFSEPNNDFSTASKISFNTTVKGQIAANDKQDIFYFTLGSAGRVDLSITSYMEVRSLYLYDSDGEKVWESWNKKWNEGLGYRKDQYVIDLKKGNYYLKVTSDTASTVNYSFKAKFTSAGTNYKEPNNDFSTAYAVKKGATVKGQIALNDKYDILKFSLPKAKTVKITVTSYMPSYSLYIYNSRGEEIWESWNNTWNENVGYRKDTYKITLSSGSYYLKMTGENDATGNYRLGIDVKPSVANAKVASVGNKTYTGKTITPSPAVTYNGKTLKKGTDYTVSYKNNKQIGTATVTITGKGSYQGTKNVTFKIIPAKITVSSIKNISGKNVTLKWGRNATGTGYEIYRSTKKDSGYKKIKTVTSNKTISYKNTKLTKGKTYYYKVRAYKTVGDEKVCGSFSAVKKIKIVR